MNLHLGGVTIDCADPHKLAEFWTRALGLEIVADHGAFVMLSSATPDGTILALHQVPEPNLTKNRLHLDLRTTTPDTEIPRLLTLGATKVTEHTAPGLSWTVLQDPEHNYFCVGHSTPTPALTP